MQPDERDRQPTAPRFLIDQNVQEAVHVYLLSRGYESFRSRDLSGVDAPDDIVAFIANSDGLVLITHDRDFRDISRLLPETQRGQFRRGAGQLLLQVPENRAVELIEDLWPSILFHFHDAQTRRIRFQMRMNLTGVHVVMNAATTRRMTAAHQDE